MADALDPIAIANTSGYGLQAALEWVANQARADTPWRFHSRERLWHHPQTHEREFIDLVFRSDEYDDIAGRLHAARLVVECKRADGRWVFLVPRRGEPVITSAVPVLSFAPTVSPSPFWVAVATAPQADLADSCVFSTRRGSAHDQADRRTLEAYSSKLLDACHDLALQERTFLATAMPPGTTQPQGFYIPVIVTTAKLTVISFDPGSVPLENGHIPPPPGSEAHDPPWVCFSKDLGFPRSPSGQSLQQAQIPLQAVYVVQAVAFAGFLTAFRHVGLVA